MAKFNRGILDKISDKRGAARIAFRFRPVSAISGLALPEAEIKCANYS